MQPRQEAPISGGADGYVQFPATPSTNSLISELLIGSGNANRTTYNKASCGDAATSAGVTYGKTIHKRHNLQGNAC